MTQKVLLIKNIRTFLISKVTSEKNFKNYKKKLKAYIKTDKRIIRHDDTEIEEYKFHQYRKTISINEIDINEIVAPNNFPFGKQDFKFFIGYKDNKEIRPLCVFFSEMSIYKRYSDNTKCMYFMIKDENKILINILKFGKKLAI